MGKAALGLNLGPHREGEKQVQEVCSHANRVSLRTICVPLLLTQNVPSCPQPLLAEGSFHSQVFDLNLATCLTHGGRSNIYSVNERMERASLAIWILCVSLHPAMHCELAPFSL